MLLRWQNFLACLILASVFPGCDKPAADTAPTVSPSIAAPTKAPATPNSFQEVAAQLDAGGSLYLYLSTEQWLAGLPQQIAAAKEAVIANATPTAKASVTDLNRLYDAIVDGVSQSGLEDATGVGFSNFALAPGINRSKFFLHHAPGKGKGFLWSLQGGPAHPLETLQILPAQTALALVHDVDFGVLHRLIAREVERLGTAEVKTSFAQGQQQLASILGMPVEAAMKSLSGPTGLVLTLDAAHQLQPQGPTGPSVPTPQLALIFLLQDEHIFNQLDKTFGTNPDLIRVDEPGLKMRTLPDMPTPLGLTMRPTAALFGNYLVVASSDQMVRDMVAAKAGAGLAKSAEFAQMAADLPTAGNGFQIVTKAFSNLVAEFQGEILKSQATSTPQQAALMKQVFSQTAGASSFAVFANLENGWLATSKTSTPAAPSNFGTILSGLLAASANQGTAQGMETESLNQAKQIYFACVRYAGDNAGRFPPDLQGLVPRYLPEARLLISPYAPEKPLGYNYTPGLTQDSPASSILLEDSQSLGSGMRVLIHVDGSGETIKIP